MCSSSATGAPIEFLSERQLEDAATPHLTRPRVLYFVFKERAAVTSGRQPREAALLTAREDYFSGPRTHSARLEEDQNPLDSMFDLPSLKLKTFWRFPTVPLGSYAHS